MSDPKVDLGGDGDALLRDKLDASKQRAIAAEPGYLQHVLLGALDSSAAAAYFYELHEAVPQLLSRLTACEARCSQLDAALVKIDAVRNDIIGRQTVDWSAHIYPLVAALGDAGYEGEGYEVASQKARTLIDEHNAAIARAETDEASHAALLGALKGLANEVTGAFGIAEVEIRVALGNILAQVLYERLEEARAAIATAEALAASPAGPVSPARQEQKEI